MNRSSKGKTILTVILLLPLVFIAYFAIVYSSNSIDASDISNISLVFEGDKVFEIDDDDGIAFYVNALMDAVEITTPLRPLESSEKVGMICDRSDKLLEYTIYPELSLSGCMLEKNDGKLYLLDNNTAKAMLSRPEFSYLYKDRFTQSLILKSGDAVSNIMPSTYEWKYRLLSGEYTSYGDSVVYDGVTVYNILADKVSGLYFDVQPQSLSVEITDENGIPVGESNIANLIFARDTLLNIKVTAEWAHNSDSLFFGKATYSFKALYDVPSTVTLSTHTVEAGSAIAVNVRHLNENENVNVDTELDISPLAFSENSGYKTALLAVDVEAQSGDYTLTFNIGGSTFTEVITVTAPKSEFRRISINSADFNRLLGDISVNELQTLIRTLNAEISAAAYADPTTKLRSPTDTGKLCAAFGDQVLMNLDGGTDSRVYYSIGDSYECVDGAKVTAAMPGKVVYSGLTLMLGNVVVVDHGCGLQTWYYGLKTSERSVGDVLKAGDIVGFAGNNDYVSSPRVCFATSVCGKFCKISN